MAPRRNSDRPRPLAEGRWRPRLRRLAPLMCVALLFPAAAHARQGGGASTGATDTTDALTRALDAEDRGESQKSAAAYREVLKGALTPGHSDGNRVALALLGLERVWAEAGARDSILPVVQRVLSVRPADPMARGIQLRTLVGLGRDDDARQAFLAWRRAAAGDGAPFREYARLLLAQGRALAADSVLTEASRLLGAAGTLSGEVAQLHVALGRWSAAAVAFRKAIVDQPYLETSAQFALQRAPTWSRDSIRHVLRAAPVLLGPRRLLSTLELVWGEPRLAWLALAAARSDDSTSSAWRDFGERAELAQSWLVARDAWSAVFEKRGDLEAQQRAAQAALNAGDAAGALEIAQQATPVIAKSDSRRAAARVRALLPIEIAALGELGRASEAQVRLDDEGARLDASSREMMVRPLIGAYLRAGDLARAKAAVQGSELVNDDETLGWLALYEGDLAAARKYLVRAATQRAELVDALGLLARTRVAFSPALGEALLTLARRDSVGASAKLELLAESFTDAAPALLGLAARLARARRSIALWDRIVRDWPKSPEAAEALLAWARVLIATGDKAGAVQRLETLLVDYPESALLPQARRELQQLTGQLPPATATSPDGLSRVD